PYLHGTIFRVPSGYAMSIHRAPVCLNFLLPRAQCQVALDAPPRESHRTILDGLGERGRGHSPGWSRRAHPLDILLDEAIQHATAFSGCWRGCRPSVGNTSMKRG